MSILPPGLTVRTCRDAIGVALALADEFAHLHAGLLLDPNGRVAAIRLHTLGASRRSTSPHAGFDHVLRWVVRQPHRWPADRGHRNEDQPNIEADRGSVLLVSVGALDLGVGLPNAAHRQLFLKAQHAAELSGYQLLDIIETDGDYVRSFAYLFDSESSWRLPSSDSESGSRRRDL